VNDSARGNAGTGHLSRLCVSIALSLTAVGCTVAAQPPSAPEQLPPQAPTTRPTGAQPEVEAAYRRFWQVAQTLDQHPESTWRPLLSQVAADPLLTDVLDGLHASTAAGYRQWGSLVLRPTIAELTATRATIVDCQDGSHSGELDTATGLATNVGQSRTAITATLAKDATGHWRVTTARYLSAQC
jgi:hypothetical protein